MNYEAAITTKWVDIKNRFKSDKEFNEAFNEAWGNMGARLMFDYVESYKRNPKALIDSFIKYNSVKFGAACVVENAIKQGLLEELKGQKDFTEWVSKQPLEEKWRGVLANFLLILWGCLK